jgi:hypothetical protein
MQCVCGFACGFAAAAAQPQSLERPHSKFSKQKKEIRKRAGSSAVPPSTQKL